MSDSDLGNAGIIQQAIRGVGSILDKIFFGLLVVVFQIFFNVASAELFTGEAILKFVGRVQLILGVFTMFQLAMSILKGIVNPDQFFSKDKGFSNVITKVVIALFLLALIMPISIPGAKNEYEKQVNNNGILFGTLYSLQHRLLSNNTLGRLILGSDNSSSTFMGDDESELKSASNIFASTILKTFIKINLVEEKDRTHVDGKTDDQISSNWVCSDMNDYVDVYKQDDVDPDTLLNLVGDTCGSDDRGNIAETISTLTASDYFKFTYSPFISTIVAGIFAFILLGFCVDVAIRAVKLSVLRIIAPVPILSYMNPRGGKDGALNSWVKTLTSTYLDLFIRLAVVYFAIFLIMDIISEGIVINIGFTENPLIGGVSTVLIFLGIFFFAKEAPKFFKDMLGLKGDSSMFGGIGKALGIGAVVAGGVGNAIRYERQHNSEVNDRIAEGEDIGMVRRGLTNVGSAIVGAISGTKVGMSALASAKDKVPSAVMNATNKSALVRESGSTFSGRAQAMALRTVGSNVESRFSQEEAARKKIMEYYKNATDWVDNKDATVKDAKDYYEDLQKSGNATRAEITRARKAYKDAQARAINERINGAPANNPDEAPVVHNDIVAANALIRKYGLKDAGNNDIAPITDSDSYKAANYGVQDANYVAKDSKARERAKANNAAIGGGTDKK